MGCARISVPGALVQTYPVERSGAFYNFALVQDSRSFLIRDVQDEFAKRRLPFAIKIPRIELYAELEKSLCEHGYSLSPTWNLMTHEASLGKSNSEVRVDVIDRSGLSDWFGIESVFSHVHSSRLAIEEMVERALVKGSVQLLTASLDGRPVGAGLLFLRNRVASIHMIATGTEFRRRHVATTITLDMLRRSENAKVDLIWLRTRTGGIGEKVYTKIGFKGFSDILTYTTTPDLEESNRA
jgi:hypothetical protein